jgi:hypothetical protein
VNHLAEPRPFRYHAPAFLAAAPHNYVRCRVCGVLFTDEQFVFEACSGIPVAVEASWTAGTVLCALCRAPVVVAAEHRATVEGFGTVCDVCAGAIVA